MVYEKQADGTFRIESVPFSNGRFVASHTSAGTSFDAQRHLTDHLGSVRCIVNSAGLVIEMNDYTPYGERFSVPSYPRSSNRYLFNGKEEIFAGLLDYGARIYDPITRRWITQDPLAEKYYSISPYTYCANNPVRYIDPFGMKFGPFAMKDVIALHELSFKGLGNCQIELEKKTLELEGRGGSDRQLEKEINRINQKIKGYEETLREIAKLDESNQMYDLVIRDNPEKTGKLDFNRNNGYVEIVMPTGYDVGLFAHELKHAYQFETGTLSMGPEYPNAPYGYTMFLYDKHDEVEAYARGGFFGGKMYNLTNLPSIYQNRPLGPVDITTHPNSMTILDNPAALQFFATNSGYIFRVNGATYY